MRYLFLFLMIVSWSCVGRSTERQKNNTQPAIADSVKKSSVQIYQIEIFKELNGFGYSITKEGVRIIYQPTIPGVSGMVGFNDSIQALSVAKLVINKIQNGVFPPSILSTELDSLKVTIPISSR